jgi:hypothetical protein
MGGWRHLFFKGSGYIIDARMETRMARLASEKDQAHGLIDRLAPSQVSAIVSVLQAMLDPVARAIATAPIDDEPESAEEKAAVARSKAWLQSEGGVARSSEEIIAELGIDKKDLNPKA